MVKGSQAISGKSLLLTACPGLLLSSVSLSVLQAPASRYSRSMLSEAPLRCLYPVLIYAGSVDGNLTGSACGAGQGASRVCSGAWWELAEAS
jgi:hypothetical protein